MVVRWFGNTAVFQEETYVTVSDSHITFLLQMHFLL